MRGWFVAFFIALSIHADPPDLKAFHPIGAARGTTNVGALSGKFDPWPPKFWSQPAGLVFKTDTNKNKVTIEIPGDAAPGARLVRVYNEDGPSEPRFFVVGAGREIAEKEPNNHLAEAQDPGEYPMTINGRLDRNDDVDCYRISLQPGEWIDAALDSYTLMSKVDGVLRLLTTNGVTVTWNHDFATLDPRLWHQAATNETLVLQVFGFVYPANADIRLTGGDEAYYRLRLAKTAPPTASATGSSSTNITKFPAEIDGIIRDGKEDRYFFSATKDQYYDIQVIAAANGSPLDANLKIRDAAGAIINQNDDADGSRDPRLEWKAPASTNYIFEVGSTLHRGGADHRYHASITPVEPDFAATFADSSLVVKAGETNALKFKVNRLRGHKNEIAPRIEGLPEGIICNATNFTAGGELSFPMIATTNAAAFQGPIKLHLTDTVSKVEKLAVFELTTRGENNGVPNGYSSLAINSFPELWLTVKTQVVKVASTNTASK
jgi:hypothetical protein